MLPYYKEVTALFLAGTRHLAPVPHWRVDKNYPCVDRYTDKTLPFYLLFRVVLSSTCEDKEFFIPGITMSTLLWH